MQKFIFSCTPCRRSLKRKLAKKYVSSAGIPLVEEANKRPGKESKNPKEPKESEESSGVKSLEERVQMLETLLEDYYLDTYFLNIVKKVRTKYDEQEDLFEKYEKSKDKKIEPIAEISEDEKEVPEDKQIKHVEIPME